VCVSVSEVLFSVGVCVCDLLIFLRRGEVFVGGAHLEVWGVVLVVCVCVGVGGVVLCRYVGV